MTKADKHFFGFKSDSIDGVISDVRVVTYNPKDVLIGR